jgi:hypothetical protein
MVQVLLEGLRADPRFEVHHVDERSCVCGLVLS